jgi:protein involved in polysaccharide export with SLBB domain
MAVLLLAACEGPFAHTGPKFDARAPIAGPVTNLSPIEVTPAANPAWLEPDNEPLTLGPGDRIEVELLNDPSTRTQLTVGPDGKVYFYLLPGLDVWGLTLAQTRALLEGELTKYMAAPQIALTLRGVESRKVWLLGRLHNSGVYQLAAPMTLLETISAAGGLLSSTTPGSIASDELADLHHSFIIRDGQFLPVDFYRLIKEGDMKQNIYVRPDDFIYVPSAMAHSVYVLGAVRVPRPVAWTDSMTLISAIANAGGTIKDACLSEVGIVRGSLTQPTIAVVNYREIVAGKASDVRLEPRDIVFVPFSPYRTLIKYANLILDTFVRAVAINEGATLVNPNASPVGVQIGVGLGAK